MFLSRLSLNVRNPLARRELADPYALHRTICTRGFGDHAREAMGRVLFRVELDRYGCNPTVLVQSETPPRWEGITEYSPNYLRSEAELKSFTPLFVSGQRLRFRLRANPTKKIAAFDDTGGRKKNGKRVELFTETQQVEWLVNKGADGGFRITGDWIQEYDSSTGELRKRPNFNVLVRPDARVVLGKRGFRDGRFHAVVFDGALEVTDAVAFQAAVANGIGSGKAFGFGLLSLARA